jgi:hypothetical protein
LLGFGDESKEIYNRYAHINLTISDTDSHSLELGHADSINLIITMNDIVKLKADYIFTTKYTFDQMNYDNFTLDKIYDEMNVKIYRIKYKFSIE